MAAANQLSHYCFGKAMLDLESQRSVLKRWHSDGFDVRRQLALRHRLVAFGEAREREQRYQKGDRTQKCFHNSDENER